MRVRTGLVLWFGLLACGGCGKEKSTGALIEDLNRLLAAYSQSMPGWHPARLEWAKKITPHDVDVLTGAAPYDRQADPDAVKNLRLLQGHLHPGQTITKLRKVVLREEMSGDLVFERSRLAGAPEDIEYEYILPISPP